jgi:hypothetical protein
VGEVEHLELCASVKVLELLLFCLRNLDAHPLSLEHLEVGFEHLDLGSGHARQAGVYLTRFYASLSYGYVG